LQEVLQLLSETDPSDDVKQQASQMLQIYNIQGENRLLKVEE
jgi:hypothetical protein